MLSPTEQLKLTCNAIHQLSEAEWEAFATIWTPMQAKRKEQLTLAGNIEKQLYFVYEGVQRVYYFDETGKEATILFTYTPSFGGVIDSFLLQQRSRFNYETLTPSKFLVADESALQKLILNHTGIETLIRKGVTNALSGVMERLVELQCFSSEEKFKQLLQRSPHILQLVPHKYLANYLGIDATNFSKLMNKIRI